MKQLYEVGEEVILAEDGKTYIVCAVVPPNQTFFDRVVQYERTSFGGTFGYLLNVSFNCKNGYAGECLWAQSALRKRHQPTSLSFNQLMNVLNSPIASPNKVQ